MRPIYSLFLQLDKLVRTRYNSGRAPCGPKDDRKAERYKEMSNMIVADNRIKSRRYDLVIDGEVVELNLSNRMANILRDEYRAEGFAVDKIETFTVTKAMKVVGEKGIKPRSDNLPQKMLDTPAATLAKIERDRVKSRTRNNLIAAKNNTNSSSVRYTSYGRNKKSLLHKEYLAALRKNGYRVYNLVTDEVWFGLQKEIAERIWTYCNTGGSIKDLNIKFLGN